MTAEYNDTNLGDISINNEVIKNIALKAATEIRGVYGIRTNPLKKIWNALRKREPAVGVSLEFSSASEVKLSLKITMGYGLNIPQYAAIVQENVKKAVEHMTGLTVTEVSVRIVELENRRDPVPGKSLEEEPGIPSEIGDETGS